MKIISKFNDYYDGVMNQGFDDSIVFVREKHQIELDKDLVKKLDFRKRSFTNIKNPYRESVEVSFFILGFCGQIFKGTRISFKDSINPEIICFDYNEFISQFPEDLLNKRWSFSDLRWIKSVVSGFFSNNQDHLEYLFHEHQTPIFKIEGESLELNPSLKDLSFYRKKDAYTAFQDIQMYLSGVLNSKENVMVQLTDVDKVFKHGFDKWSFRKKGKNSL